MMVHPRRPSPLYMVDLPGRDQVWYDESNPNRHTKGSLRDRLRVQLGFDDRQDICAEAGEWGVVMYHNRKVDGHPRHREEFVPEWNSANKVRQ
eukprot:3862758-Karenia_brevis.AAC.1